MNTVLVISNGTGHWPNSCSSLSTGQVLVSMSQF